MYERKERIFEFLTLYGKHVKKKTIQKTKIEARERHNRIMNLPICLPTEYYKAKLIETILRIFFII